MGYQIVEVSQKNTYQKHKLIVLNSQVAVEMSGNYSTQIRTIINEGIEKIKFSANKINLSSYSLKFYSEKEFRNEVNEDTIKYEKGAIENPKETANGKETFVRLSAFQDDKRIDKVKKCLRPGSFATNLIDYKTCKDTKDNPIERYALPSEEKIEWVFFIIPKKSDTLQRGKVQPANGKRGGGAEAYFEQGTSECTFNAEGKF